MKYGVSSEDTKAIWVLRVLLIIVACWNIFCVVSSAKDINKAFKK